MHSMSITKDVLSTGSSCAACEKISLNSTSVTCTESHELQLLIGQEPEGPGQANVKLPTPPALENR